MSDETVPHIGHGQIRSELYNVMPVDNYPHEDDAFGTIMQWLYSRIPQTRGGRQ